MVKQVLAGLDNASMTKITMYLIVFIVVALWRTDLMILIIEKLCS